MNSLEPQTLAEADVNPNNLPKWSRVCQSQASEWSVRTHVGLVIICSNLDVMSTLPCHALLEVWKAGNLPVSQHTRRTQVEPRPVQPVFAGLDWSRANGLEKSEPELLELLQPEPEQLAGATANLPHRSAGEVRLLGSSGGESCNFLAYL